MSHPGGRSYDVYPRNALEAESRRISRFQAMGHTPGPSAAPPIEPRTELPQLKELYPQAEHALARLHVTYRPGEDNLPEILAELNRIFPRWYSRDHAALRPESISNAKNDPHEAAAIASGQPAAVIRRYLEQTLAVDDPDREALLALAGELLDGQA